MSGSQPQPRSSATPAPSPSKSAYPAGAVDVTKTHEVTAGEPITYETSGHPPRSDSPTYVKSRAALKQIAASVKGWYFQKAEQPYQDHHGGGLWLYDDQGWFFVRNLVGIEWSAQFCADPKKVDVLRQNAARGTMPLSNRTQVVQPLATSLIGATDRLQ